MTTKELIRAEIKKLQDIFVETAKEMETEDEATVYSMCAVEFGDELLSFLDTLPDESITTCNELAEAAMNYIAPIENEDGLNVINFSGQDVADAFEAGAEWQKKQFEKKES